MLAAMTLETESQFIMNALNSVAINHELNKFQPKVELHVEYGDYLIETAKSAQDLRKIIELRHHSFVSEFLPGEQINWLDFDELDLIADHVLVKKVSTAEILGTYRILCSHFTDQFYTEQQFDLGGFKRTPGVKIELGRAVTHKDHRNGAIISLVWKGLAQYAIRTRADFMFGCASIKTTSQQIAESIYWHLYPAYFKDVYKMTVLDQYKFQAQQEVTSLLPWQEVEKEIPTLLKTYLQAGAHICTKPALDQFLKCIDFVTVMNLQNLDAKYRRRYF